MPQIALNRPSASDHKRGGFACARDTGPAKFSIFIADSPHFHRLVFAVSPQLVRAGIEAMTDCPLPLRQTSFHEHRGDAFNLGIAHARKIHQRYPTNAFMRILRQQINDVFCAFHSRITPALNRCCAVLLVVASLTEIPMRH